MAISLLKKEFLDIPYITDESFRQLLDNNPKYDPDFANVTKYLLVIKADLSELKAYDLNFYEESTPGFELVTHIIFLSCPLRFKEI